MKKVLLTDVCDIQYGYPFDSTLFNDREGTPLIRIRDIVRGFSETYTTEQAPKDYLVYQGDILVGMDGEFNVAKWGGTPGVLNQRVCRIFPSRLIDKEYLFHYLPVALKRIEDATPFVTVKHLSAKALAKIQIPAHEPLLQTKIANSLSGICSLINIRKAQLLKLDQLASSRFIEMFGDPVTNPKGWQQEQLDSHIDVLTGFPFDSSKYVDSGIKICGGLIIMPDRIAWENCKYWITSDNFSEYLLAAGDIVIALDRPWISDGFKIGVISESDLPCLLIQRTARVRGKDVNQNFLYALLKSEAFQKHCTVTGSLVPHISHKDLKNFIAFLPPLELQNEFAAFVEQLDKSKVTIRKSIEKLETTYRALLQEYFG